jgi:hypothetical protein
MAPIPPSRRRGFQFRAEELDDLMDLVESFLPISAQNWQAVADVHLENYRREARTAESLRRKFQEISRRTGPTGDPNCPPYVIKAKRINRQLVQMIDASSGGSEAGRSDDGLSDAASDSEYEGAGEFANVMNQMNNAAANGGEEEIDEEDDADDAGIGVQADDDGVVGAVAGVAPPPDGDNAPPDGVAPVVARPRGRGPGRSRTVPIGPPAAAAVARNGSAAPAPAVARNGSDGQMSSSSGTAAGDRGRAFRTLINRGRKKSRTDDDDEGGFSMSNVMGMMMVQQRSEQSSREADRMAREAELTLRREEIAMRREEMTSQLQIQREESRSHQQMMNVMLMAMMQNIAGTHRGTNDQQQPMEIGGNNQQEQHISGTIQQNDENND